MSTNKLEQEKLQENVNDQTNLDSLQMVDRKQVPGTPFWMVRFEDSWYLVMGKHRLTDGMSEEECKEYLVNNQMTLILQMIICVIKDTGNFIKNEKVKK